ncbi:MAG: hypothetical protein AABN33_17635 [Acidobacteriota bacterium]
MKSCNYIKERIDEADKPNLLSFEVTEHISECSDCERFASDRSALRMLVASGTRVSAPINFNVRLNARLAEVKVRRSFRWLGSPGYLRLGAATAGLVVMVFAAQYAGLLKDQSRLTDSRGQQAAQTPKPEQFGYPTLSPEVPRSSNLPVVAASGRRYPVYSGTTAPRARRGDLAVSGVAPASYLTAEDGGVVLVRGQNGDMDVQMPTVSVGAQPLLYVRASQRAVRNIGTSF